MHISQQILSDITVHMKYARYLPEHNRRETWTETVQRNIDMHCDKYPELADRIREQYQYVFDKKVLPSMRSAQFAGQAIRQSPVRMYNCSFAPINDYRVFGEIMFLLLSGVGVGYSVQASHCAKLPMIIRPTSKRRYLIEDSIEGWSDSVKALLKAYLCEKSLPVFDFGNIRAKGTALKTSGGKAPGPEPLKDCLHNITRILDRKVNGERLTPLECHDIICFEADAVLAGGIRRSACIALFDYDDNDMLECKFDAWYELNGQRGRANNSVVLHRQTTTRSMFDEVFDKIRASNSGEPGIFWTNDSNEWGQNPCSEIALGPITRGGGMCNLTEVNVSDVTGQEDLEARCYAAAFIGTLQAGYTDFHYLRDSWRSNVERDALLGVSMTGIASGTVLSLDLEQAARVAKQCNRTVAQQIGIKPASRITCVKPAGTTSCVLGTSSGIHDWHAPYYIRRVRVGKQESIYRYLVQHLPGLIEDDVLKPHTQACISIPQQAPDQALTDSTAIQMLERIKHVNRTWIKGGHVDGVNSHNVSCTVYCRPNEWEGVRQWMWENREHYNGLTLLPYDGGNYAQMPFESITEEHYRELVRQLSAIDLSQVNEQEDVNHLQEAACAGGACTLTQL